MYDILSEIRRILLDFFIRQAQVLLLITAFHPHTHTPMDSELQVLAGMSVKPRGKQTAGVWVEDQFLRSWENGGGAQSTDELPSAKLVSAAGLCRVHCNGLDRPQWPLWVAGASTGATKCRLLFSMISAMNSSLPLN